MEIKISQISTTGELEAVQEAITWWYVYGKEFGIEEVADSITIIPLPLGRRHEAFGAPVWAQTIDNSVTEYMYRQPSSYALAKSVHGWFAGFISSEEI